MKKVYCLDPDFNFPLLIHGNDKTLLSLVDYTQGEKLNSTDLCFKRTFYENSLEKHLNNLPLGDLASGGHPPILSEVAVNFLKDLIKKDVEIIPVKCIDCNNKTFFILDIKKINALDFDKSEVVRFTVSSRVKKITKHVFISDKLKNIHIFRIPESPHDFVSEEFVQKVKESGLKGFKFTKTDDLKW
ncbi:MAG: hypothetical protein Q7K42_06565 [Candidatus Diapherotrites archaeon]|nr:hypothetical protein [Candidatus Diapherotrites archaeon]